MGTLMQIWLGRDGMNTYPVATCGQIFYGQY